MDFEIKPGHRRSEQWVIGYATRDPELISAFHKAMEEKGLKARPLLDQMIQHCLTESGYLKSKKGAHNGKN